MYNRRCRMNPWWIDLLVGGVQDGEPFLGHVDVRGRAYEDKAVATGFGKHLAVPLLREYTENPNAVLDYDGAQALVSDPRHTAFMLHRINRSLISPICYFHSTRSDEEVHGSAVLS